MRRHRVLTLAAFASLLCSAALGQPRSLRLFFSQAGLTNPADAASPAAPPDADLGTNPHFTVAAGQSQRLYVWAQITPPGTPNNVAFNRMSLITRVSGVGVAVVGANFWNYANGAYRRWDQLAFEHVGANASFLATSELLGSGVNYTSAANNADTHYRRNTADGAARIDSTLLGWVDVAGAAPGATLEVRFAIGTLAIVEVGQPPRRVYLGWGDEADAPLGDEYGASSPIADAYVHVAVPEPRSGLALLLALGGFAGVRRRCAAVAAQVVHGSN